MRTHSRVRHLQLVGQRGVLCVRVRRNCGGLQRVSQRAEVGALPCSQYARHCRCVYFGDAIIIAVAVAAATVGAERSQGRAKFSFLVGIIPHGDWMQAGK